MHERPRSVSDPNSPLRRRPGQGVVRTEMSGTSSLIIAILAAVEGAIGLAVLVTDLRARVARRRVVAGPASPAAPAA
jgi:hypothetical protein